MSKESTPRRYPTTWLQQRRLEASMGPDAIPSIDSDELLQGGRELHILHGTEVYRLLKTRNNKLILQK